MSDQMSPEGVVARYFDLLRGQRYDDAVALVAPVRLRRFAEHEAPRHRPAPLMTVERYLERNPDMPREVAEYYVSQSATHPQPAISDYYAGVTSEDELESLSDRELYARHIEAVDPAGHGRRQIDQLRALHPEYESQLVAIRERLSETWNMVIPGSVVIGGRALVLFEQPVSAEPDELRWEPVPHVAVLRMTADGWRLASDPSPYSGMGVLLAPIEVTNAEGEKVVLDLESPA